MCINRSTNHNQILVLCLKTEFILTIRSLDMIQRQLVPAENLENISCIAFNVATIAASSAERRFLI